MQFSFFLVTGLALALLALAGAVMLVVETTKARRKVRLATTLRDESLRESALRASDEPQEGVDVIPPNSRSILGPEDAMAEAIRAYMNPMPAEDVWRSIFDLSLEFAPVYHQEKLSRPVEAVISKGLELQVYPDLSLDTRNDQRHGASILGQSVSIKSFKIPQGTVVKRSAQVVKDQETVIYPYDRQVRH